MDPAIIKMCSDILTQNVVPFGMNFMNRKIEHRLQRELMDKEMSVDSKMAAVFNKMSRSDLSQETQPVSNNQELGLTDFEDLDAFHEAKWIQYFGTLEDLDENASVKKVKSTMGEILDDIKEYPCDSCKENAKVHLDGLKNKGIPFLEVRTKSEALERLCDFKNEINEMKGNPQYDCRIVVTNGYQKKKF